MKINNTKLTQMIERLNSKLGCYEVVGEPAIEVRHDEYGFICILDESEDIKLAEEIVRDELFDKSEAAN